MTIEFTEKDIEALEALEEKLSWGYSDDRVRKHKRMAEQELKKIEAVGFTVVDSWMAGDGWMDGWRCLHAEIEDERTGERHEIHWNDGNEEFFIDSAGVGSWPLRNEAGFGFLED